MKRILIPSLIALAALTATPASAGGSVSFEFTPSNPDEEIAVRLGLALYAIGRAIESDASVIQNGDGNAAGIGQFGSGNFGVIEQNGETGMYRQALVEGTGHCETLATEGAGMSCERRNSPPTSAQRIRAPWAVPEM